MRLIDADELTEMVWRERLDTRERIAHLIARQPTIKSTAYERGFIDGVKSKVTAELTPVITKMAGGLNQTIQEAVKTVIGNVKITAHEPDSDVQPLSVVAEHIKKRLYETAFNTTEEKAINAIADMAGRIDFWIDELKDGDTK